MSNKGVRNLFVLGSLFFFIIFVVLTVDTMKKIDERAPEITETVNQGKMLWHKYDCIGCHTIFGNGSYFAPDLTKATVNKPAGYLKSFLVNPRKVNPEAAMPVLGISEAEAEKIVAFLDWTSRVDTNGWPPEPVLAGMRTATSGGIALFQKHGCTACHLIKGIGGTAGPDLSQVGTRRPDVEWHLRHLENPASLTPGSPMPSYGHLDANELRQLAEYMTSLK